MWRDLFRGPVPLWNHQPNATKYNQSLCRLSFLTLPCSLGIQYFQHAHFFCIYAHFLFFKLHNPFSSSPFRFISPRMQDIPFYVLILFFLLIPTSLVSPLYGSSSYSFSLCYSQTQLLSTHKILLNILCFVSSLQMGPYMTSLPTLR